MNRILPIVPAQETVRIVQYSGLGDCGIPPCTAQPAESSAKLLRKLLADCCAYQNKPRFLSKNVNDGLRMQLMDKIFPDAFFVHIVRDGRANAASYLEVAFFQELKFWWNDNRSFDAWTEKGRNPVELAALHWRHNV